MWFGREKDTLFMTCLARRAKVCNLRRDPQASVLINGPGCYVSFRGRVTIERDLSEAEVYLDRLLGRYLPESSRESFRRKLADPTRVTLRFVPHDCHSHRIKAWTNRQI